LIDEFLAVNSDTDLQSQSEQNKVPNINVMGRLLKKGPQPKGDRLNWEPLTSSKPVKITSEMLVGKRLSEEELKRNANFSTNYKIP